MIGLAQASGQLGELVQKLLDERGVAYRPGCEAVDVVINLAGEPRLEHVETAVAAGAGYVDGCSDPDWANRVYDHVGTAPVLVVPGCAPDAVLSDLAAAIAASGLASREPPDVVVGYDFGGAVPRQARPGRWPRRRQIRFPDGARRGVEVQWGEQVRVPRWLPGAHVTTVIAVPEGTAALLQVGGLLDPLTRWLPSPVAAVPRQVGFRLLAEAGAGPHRAGVSVEAAGGSDLVARILVEAALQAGGAGALTPAQALDPEPFLQTLLGTDLTWQRVDSRP